MVSLCIDLIIYNDDWGAMWVLWCIFSDILAIYDIFRHASHQIKTEYHAFSGVLVI